MTSPPIPVVLSKPRWRGVLHHWAALIAVVVAPVLILAALSSRARFAAAVYVASLVLLFAVSATYHRVTWSPRARVWWRRADHASIYLLIAGTYTPIAALALDRAAGDPLLRLIWAGCAAGVLVAMFWPSAPKWVGAAIALALGWTVVPYGAALRAALDAGPLWLIAIGGAAYTLGAIVYAVRRPNPRPATFGYHEVFHALTLVGAATHLVAIWIIVRAH
jgi:hemolysin III